MLRFLYRRAQARGLFGGSRPWTVVWAVLLAARVVRRLTGREEEVVFRTELHPGESLVVSHDRDARVVGHPE